jgi:hypothetical protein
MSLTLQKKCNIRASTEIVEEYIGSCLERFVGLVLAKASALLYCTSFETREIVCFPHSRTIRPTQGQGSAHGMSSRGELDDHRSSTLETVYSERGSNCDCDI